MTKVESEIEFRGGIFFLEFVECINFTVSGSGALSPRTLTRTFQTAACLCMRRPSRLLPASGVRISRFLPPCARRKQAQYLSCPSRPASFVYERCRCAPPADALGWACVSPAMLTGACPLQRRARAARDSLNAKRRARAARVCTFRTLPDRARLCGCTFFLSFCRSLSVRSLRLVSRQ